MSGKSDKTSNDLDGWDLDVPEDDGPGFDVPAEEKNMLDETMQNEPDGENDPLQDDAMHWLSDDDVQMYDYMQRHQQQMDDLDDGVIAMDDALLHSLSKDMHGITEIDKLGDKTITSPDRPKSTDSTEPPTNKKARRLKARRFCLHEGECNCVSFRF